MQMATTRDTPQSPMLIVQRTVSNSSLVPMRHMAIMGFASCLQVVWNFDQKTVSQCTRRCVPEVIESALCYLFYVFKRFNS